MASHRKIFISYAKEDIRYALVVFDYLERLSYEPWLDKKRLLPGSNWDLEIKRALEQSDFIILLLSSASVSKRGYVQKEYKLALQHWEKRLDDDIYIIPVLINECVVPESLRRFQWVMFEEAFPAILESIEKQRLVLSKIASRGYFRLGNVDVEKKVRQHEFTTYDITLISLLSQGLLQKDIPSKLQEQNIKPGGLSAIEKRLNIIKANLGIYSNEQLVAYCKKTMLI